jgi:hypothetical protein
MNQEVVADYRVDRTGGRSVSVAKVTIAGVEHHATETSPVVFGRAGVTGVVGLDASDKGISGMAGSVEWKTLWFVVNRSRKRKLYIDDGAGGGPQPLHCGQLRVVNASPLTIRVRGDIRTHTIGVSVPDADLPRYSGNAISTGTLLPEIWLDDDDRKAVVALFRGYLLPAPRYQPWPRTYAEAAGWLEDDWTATALRKRIERLKLRLSRTGPPFEGRRANHDLAEYLIINNVIGPEDLSPGASGGGVG